MKAVSDSVKETAAVTAKRGKITIPWFAFGFLAVIGFNSFDLLPHAVVDGINNIDTFMLTMAMRHWVRKLVSRSLRKPERNLSSWRQYCISGC